MTPPADDPHDLPQMDFATFLLSLNHSVRMHLGDAPHPDGSVERDPALAKQSLEILELLQEKTKGNLTGAEERLMSQLLHDLRLRFAEISRGAGGL
ncbi:MAG: DUF1844 domain-containing protein [Myxococcales bacterium]|nr:DUF1844 domain-containing protein [Polyangiaceae bacterium]MDW8248408.1 DUF1844 domain-containing protein [Myxococcales bacterium]